MPGGDDFYDDATEIDDGLVEMFMIVGLAAMLAFLVYYRQQRQQEARRRAEQQGQQQGGNVNAAPQQQQDQGFFPPPGEPEFANWVAGEWATEHYPLWPCFTHLEVIAQGRSLASQKLHFIIHHSGSYRFTVCSPVQERVHPIGLVVEVQFTDEIGQILTGINTLGHAGSGVDNETNCVYPYRVRRSFPETSSFLDNNNHSIMSDYETYNLGDFELQNGDTIPSAKIAYKTFGNKTSPAIIYPTWYSGCKLAPFCKKRRIP
ncbi:unnamed protein product [Aureobasidium uvarum]|uniref:Uncharacterized protein n=1 Tax=Aureobasidium uvarum TaxID=2773716 RepID=A0A9N8PUC4_9PEZI|nr:unnamed protein product [Aureobasidium uvarum]